MKDNWDRYLRIWQTRRDKLLLFGSTKGITRKGDDFDFKTAINSPTQGAPGTTSLLLKQLELEADNSSAYSMHVTFNRTDYQTGRCKYNLGNGS